MNANEYQQAALRTDAPVPSGVMNEKMWRLLHGAIGMATETGELQDQIKKNFFYGKPLDTANVLEECGDVLWYIAVALDSCGYTMEQAMERNIFKLKQRYPDKFTTDKALNRDLDAERRALEGE